MSPKRIETDVAEDSDDEFLRVTKRQRLSSPTYDDQVELSQDQVAAFDAFERTLSQTTLSQAKPSQAVSASAKKRRDGAIALALSQHVFGHDSDMSSSQSHDHSSDDKDLFRRPLFPISSVTNSSSSPSGHTSQPRLPGFGSALQIPSAIDPVDVPAQPSSSPVGAEQDMEEWFQSSDAPERGLMFKSAKDITVHEDDSMLDDWFKARAPANAIGFQSAKSIKTAKELTAGPQDTPSEVAPDFSGFVSGAHLHTSINKSATSPAASQASTTGDAPAPALVGFTSGATLLDPNAKKSGWLAPSAEALAKAAAKMKQWERELETEIGYDSDGDIFDGETESPSRPRSSEHPATRSLPTFGGARSALGATQRSFAPASQHDNTTARPVESSSPVAPTFKTPSVVSGSRVGFQGNATPFKPPLLVKPASAGTHVPSPLNPKSSSSSFMTPFTPAHRQPVPVTPVRSTSTPNPSSFTPSSLFAGSASGTAFTPKRNLGTTPRRMTPMSSMKKAFVTPFKPGMRPGEPGRAQLAARASPAPPSSISISTAPSTYRDKGKARASFFDLTKSNDRQTLAASGLTPQRYTFEDLEEMGINVSELSQMTPDLALYYSFHSYEPTPLLLSTQQLPPPTALTLGVAAAFDELKSIGCTLVTKEWVENHWNLILWKLAGMVCLDPATESDPARKRWCWREVMNQLRYRYERELNRGQRPPLRKIVAQDAAASAPMVLCVSNITWSPESIADDGSLIPAVPAMEVTDGWYRLNAEIDDPIERAIRNGKIRVGTKIAMIGCRTRADRKDGGEILEVGQSIRLQIHGNSSHLAPWHAKLGFQKEPFVATLGSLDAFGGLVSALEVVILKTYPVAYLEFFVTEDGRKYQEGPIGEAEEAALNEKWQARREHEAKKLRDGYETNLRRLTDYTERLVRKATPSFRPGDDESPPDSIDDMLLELEDCSDGEGRDLIKRINPREAGWLARAIKDKCRRDEESIGEEIERDLNFACPPRNVKSFRIVLARDARTNRRPAQREVQITVWDVLSLQLAEDDKPGNFKPGQHLLVTNLYPSKPGCWMPAREDDSVIYLASRKESTWTLLGSGHH